MVVKCPEILFVVLPTEMKNYADIKQVANRKYFLPIQVLDAQKFQSSRAAYHTSVAMKLNTKLASCRLPTIPRARKLELTNWLKETDTAVIGITKASRKISHRPTFYSNLINCFPRGRKRRKGSGSWDGVA